MTDDRVTIWVIYDRPLDHPEHIVVRAQYALPNGTVVADRHALLFTRVEDARKHLESNGLYCLGRQPDDQPQIVECCI